MAKHWPLSEFLYQHHLEVGNKVNLNSGANEDEDLNKHEVSKEASVSDKGQKDFYDSSDEEVDVSTDDNDSLTSKMN